MVRTKDELTSVAAVLRAAWGVRSDFNVHGWWRGLLDSKHRLVASVFREPRGHRAEANMLAQFMTAAPSRRRRLPDRRDAAGWLFLAQHHGLPTRLLDWTDAVLTGLFFAVTPPNGRAGVLWALNPYGLNARFASPLGVFLPSAKEIAPLFLGAFSGKTTGHDLVAAVHPIEVDLRMLLQASRFTVHESGTALENQVKDRSILRRFLIPAEAKVKIAAELECLGFRRSALFPDLRILADDIASQRFRENL